MKYQPILGNVESLLATVHDAAATGKLSASAARHIRTWLTEPSYAEYASQVAEHIQKGLWAELDEVFWQVIPFGTGGRRGKMYPIGTNAINARTMGESAQGVAEYVADYVRQHEPGQPLRCAIAYDSRHRSPEFARLCGEVMAANGFQVYFLEGFRSTPELSFAVRYKKCSCGLMITASHNPPEDNAIKVYWSSGGQLLPPHDEGVIQRVMAVREVRRVDFQQAMAEGKIVLCQEEVDAAFQQAVLQQRRPGPRELKILYSPLHGVGASAVVPVLQADGFTQLEVFGPHASPDGDFPNVPGRMANPENPKVFDPLIKYAQTKGFELILATDPDADRVGCAAPVRWTSEAAWQTFTGNQIGALLADYLLHHAKQSGRLTPHHYVVKTAVTTELIRQIAEAYGVRCVGNLLVGFKWIGGVIEELGPEGFVLGAEESYGFLIGDHARDKDAAVASMVLAELAAEAKHTGQTLYQKLLELFARYGCHQERAFSQQMPGSEGMQKMQALMNRLRREAPGQIGPWQVVLVEDYLQALCYKPGQSPQPMPVHQKGDMIFLHLLLKTEPENSYRVAVRPSGTEPKVKFYLFAYQPPKSAEEIEKTMQHLQNQLASLQSHLEEYINQGNTSAK
ncbi:MAG: phospho-sugar mutase [Thermoguttaceae bacterium]|nr:phospho-sugar mutase [Thermoguttaceae bacterium]MDW8038069.1 phospho-sugar mutase [Thermoguttaceae bacterium]